MKRKVLSALAGLVLIALGGAARAEMTTVTPNYIGGYNVFTPGQPPTSITPNYMGGFNSFTPGQPPTSITPNYMGGYNVFTPGR